MKVMSWNTLYGGFDGEDDRRFRLQAEVVATVAPDVLVLQEARRFEADGNRRLYAVEQAFGMRGFMAMAPHTGQNTVVFARPGSSRSRSPAIAYISTTRRPWQRCLFPASADPSPSSASISARWACRCG